MYARKNSRNRAQRSRDKGFVPERDEKTREERSSTGGYEEITRYNDWSSTRHSAGRAATKTTTNSATSVK